MSFFGLTSVIDPYIAADARVAWRPRKNLELPVVGKNLFDNHRPEFAGSPRGEVAGTPLAEIRRSIYGMIKWNFGG